MHYSLLKAPLVSPFIAHGAALRSSFAWLIQLGWCFRALVTTRGRSSVLSLPASAADCERTFSELGDMLGTRRLRMKEELITALQCLKTWRRIGVKTPKPSYTADELAAIQAHISNHESFFDPINQPINQADPKTSFLAINYDSLDALAIDLVRPRGSGLPNMGGGLIEIGLT
jgi:hypothetical protein